MKPIADPAPSLPRRRTADLLVILALAGLVAVYGYATLSASTAVLHVILVLPLAIVTLLLCAFEVLRLLLRPAKPDEAEESSESETIADSGLVIVLFIAYVASLPWLGFDVGTCVFIAAFLRLHGEKRWAWLIAYSLVLGLGLALVFSAVFPYPMPLVLLQAVAG